MCTSWVLFDGSWSHRPVDNFLVIHRLTAVPCANRCIRFSVWPMNLFAACVGATSTAIDTLAHFDAGVLRDAGANPNRITDWAKAHTAYYGPTRFTRQQAHAITIARDTGKSLDQLVFIEKQLTGLTSDKETWRLRLALLSVPGNYAALRRRAKDICECSPKSSPLALFEK